MSKIRRRLFALLLITLSAGALAAPSMSGAVVQPHGRYCGPKFVLHERFGVGASDFYVNGVTCARAKAVADAWFHARSPRRIDGWRVRGGYEKRLSRQRAVFYFALFGAD